MTKQVALSDHAYGRLRATRLPGESFSQVVERLIDHQAKDPMRFRSRLDGLPADISADDSLAALKKERDATRGPA